MAIGHQRLALGRAVEEDSAGCWVSSVLPDLKEDSGGY
jgi:hypothetical protein